MRRWRRQHLAERLPQTGPLAASPIPFTLEGLTEAEAEACRLEGQDNSIPFRPQRSFPQVLRENIYTVFNLSLVGLSFAQLLSGLPLDVLLSLGMIGVNAALNFGQKAFARIRIRNIEAATRQRATVIRESKVRSIDPNEVVLGDILVAASGDQLLVDGAVVEGQSLFLSSLDPVGARVVPIGATPADGGLFDRWRCRTWLGDHRAPDLVVHPPAPKSKDPGS